MDFKKDLHAVDLAAYGNFLANQVEAYDEQMARAREVLASRASDPSVLPDSLATDLNHLATLRGCRTVLSRASLILKNAVAEDTEPRYAIAYLLGAILEETGYLDDKWSGRTNDVRRAEYEGKTEAAKTVQRRINTWMVQ